MEWNAKASNDNMVEIPMNSVAEEEKTFITSSNLVINGGKEKNKNMGTEEEAVVVNTDRNAVTVKFRKYSGVIFALLGGFCFTLAGLLVKILKDCDPISLTFWRYLGFIILITPFWIYHVLVQRKDVVESKTDNNEDEDGPGKWKKLLALWVSGFLSATGMLLIFCSLSFMSLADSTVVLFCGPIVVIVFAHFCLQEKCGVVTIPIALWTMLGVLVITRPPMLTGESSFDEDTLIGTGLVFGALLSLALYFIVMRTLRKEHIATTSIVNGICGFFECVLVAIIFDVHCIPNGLRAILLTIMLCVVAFLGQIFITLALKFEQAGTVSMVRASEVIFAFFWQILFLGIAPDIYSVVGAIIVVIGVLLTTFRKWLSTLPKGNPMREKFKFLLK